MYNLHTFGLVVPKGVLLLLIDGNHQAIQELRPPWMYLDQSAHHWAVGIWNVASISDSKDQVLLVDVRTRKPFWEIQIQDKWA